MMSLQPLPAACFPSATSAPCWSGQTGASELDRGPSAFMFLTSPNFSHSPIPLSGFSLPSYKTIPLPFHFPLAPFIKRVKTRHYILRKYHITLLKDNTVFIKALPRPASGFVSCLCALFFFFCFLSRVNIHVDHSSKGYIKSFLFTINYCHAEISYVTRKSLVSFPFCRIRRAQGRVRECNVKEGKAL